MHNNLFFFLLSLIKIHTHHLTFYDFLGFITDLGRRSLQLCRCRSAVMISQYDCLVKVQLMNDCNRVRVRWDSQLPFLPDKAMEMMMSLEIYLKCVRSTVII